MGFRISIGTGCCEGSETASDVVRKSCAEIKRRLEFLKNKSVQDLRDLPESHSAEIDVDGEQVIISTYQYAKDERHTLVVVQAAIPTWKYPTFFSMSFVGKVLAEGFVISSDGQILEASDYDLAEFR